MTFLRKLHIHPILIIFIGLSIITGTFVHLFILFSIILIHELGHYMMAQYYRWEIHSIMLWVFGGVMKTDESTNHPIKQDIVVTIAGPLQHILIIIVLYVSTYFSFFSPAIIQVAYYYNIILLVFNLLPIYPLDGGKIILYILSANIPFKRAHELTILFSIIACVALILFQLLLFPFTLSSFLLIVFLAWENRTEWKNRSFIFLRFLLHRQPKKRHSTLFIPGHFRLMDVFYLFRRNRSHSIYIKNLNKVIPEEQCLALYFKKQKITETVNELWEK